MMCSRTPFTLVSLSNETSLLGYWLAPCLKSQIVHQCPNIIMLVDRTTDTSRKHGLYKHDTNVIRSLLEFMKSQFSWSASIRNFRFVFPNSIIYVYAPKMKENSLLPYFIVITVNFRNIYCNIKNIRMWKNYINKYTCLCKRNLRQNRQLSCFTNVNHAFNKYESKT